jgi:hypothetical protein
LDGESLRAMRNWGWLELGYTERYLRDLFRELRLGFQWYKSAVAAPHSELVIGSRASFGETNLDDVVDHYPAKLADGIDFAKDGLPSFISTISGLSHKEEWGRWSEGDHVHIEFVRPLPSTFTLTLRLAQVFGPNLHEVLRVKVGAQEHEIQLKDPSTTALYSFQFDSIESRSIRIFIPKPTRPSEVAALNNHDARELGIGLRSMSIENGIVNKRQSFLRRLFK